MSARRAGALACSTALATWFGPALLRSRAFRLTACPTLAGRIEAEHIAISFDDGPHAGGTPAVLDALRALEVRATFFLLGSQVLRHPDLAARIASEDHEIGVHGFSHRNHLRRGWRDVHLDVRQAARVITAATGVTPALFRPPYGVFTAATVAAARAAGLRPVLWTAWGRDWETRDPARALRTLAAQVGRGGTILLHDSDVVSGLSGSWSSAAGALPGIVAGARDLGCGLGTVGEHLALGRAGTAARAALQAGR